MDNGMEVVAKLPNPNAGPTHYTTASEVATRKLLRDVFSIPVPRVLSWSHDAASNPVQAEYILEEKASGARLGVLWSSLPWRTKLAIVEQVVNIDSSLTSVQFKTHGYVVQLAADRQSLNLDQYAMGPLTKTELWANCREQMNLDRGPWQDPQLYTQALGTNEMAWIQRFAKPRMNYFRSLEDPEIPEHALELLAKYERVAPVLVPSVNDSATANVLWHPDLHLDNVFVNPASYEITAIVDWQSAMVAPLFYQSGVHRAFRHYKSVHEGWYVPDKPENFDALPPDEQKRVDWELESETIHKYYELQTMKRAPRHWEYLQQPMIPVLRKPVWLVTGVWENNDLFFLRDSLIALFTKWSEIFDEDVQCPITFSAEELERHAREEENIDGVGKMLSLFRDQGVLPADGMVQPDDYQTAVENCRKYKQIFLNAAQNQYEQGLYSKIWPYQGVCDETQSSRS
ncbi:MAG: hypothetical protein M1822_007801 [Bathelium mastoideum]|nr:MAG: hypothetical protein M1822_007801 [Bathelium mastoideum]